MHDDPTSLDHLHDIALPGEVSWWPLAAGWHVVLALSMMVAIRCLWHAWVRWNANAYRREALLQLAEAKDFVTVAEILRRAALVLVPRHVIANLSGEAWVTWLTDRCTTPLPPDVRELLASGVYRRPVHPSDDANTLASVKAYASHWIREHRATSNVTFTDRIPA